MRVPIGAILLSAALASGAEAADADAGARLFKTQCATCHAAVAGRNLVGPSLYGVVGRKAGDVVGFRYSAANKAADLSWDAAHLDAYVADPRSKMPGTSMLYAGMKDPGQRADLIAYLETLK